MAKSILRKGLETLALGGILGVVGCATSLSNYVSKSKSPTYEDGIIKQEAGWKQVWFSGLHQNIGLKDKVKEYPKIENGKMYFLGRGRLCYEEGDAVRTATYNVVNESSKIRFKAKLGTYGLGGSVKECDSHKLMRKTGKEEAWVAYCLLEAPIKDNEVRQIIKEKYFK